MFLLQLTLHLPAGAATVSCEVVTAGTLRLLLIGGIPCVPLLSHHQGKDKKALGYVPPLLYKSGNVADAQGKSLLHHMSLSPGAVSQVNALLPETHRFKRGPGSSARVLLLTRIALSRLESPDCPPFYAQLRKYASIYVCFFCAFAVLLICAFPYRSLPCRCEVQQVVDLLEESQKSAVRGKRGRKAKQH